MLKLMHSEEKQLTFDPFLELENGPNSPKTINSTYSGKIKLCHLDNVIAVCQTELGLLPGWTYKTSNTKGWHFWKHLRNLPCLFDNWLGQEHHVTCFPPGAVREGQASLNKAGDILKRAQAWQWDLPASPHLLQVPT